MVANVYLTTIKLLLSLGRLFCLSLSSFFAGGVSVSRSKQTNYILTLNCDLRQQYWCKLLILCNIELYIQIACERNPSPSKPLTSFHRTHLKFKTVQVLFLSAHFNVSRNKLKYWFGSINGNLISHRRLKYESKRSVLTGAISNGRQTRNANHKCFRRKKNVFIIIIKEDLSKWNKMDGKPIRSPPLDCCSFVEIKVRVYLFNTSRENICFNPVDTIVSCTVSSF